MNIYRLAHNSSSTGRSTTFIINSTYNRQPDDYRNNTRRYHRINFVTFGSSCCKSGLESWSNSIAIAREDDEHFIGRGSDVTRLITARSFQQCVGIRRIAIGNANEVTAGFCVEVAERQGDRVTSRCSNDPTDAVQIVVIVRIVWRFDGAAGRCQHRTVRVTGIEPRKRSCRRARSEDDENFFF